MREVKIPSLEYLQEQKAILIQGSLCATDSQQGTHLQHLASRSLYDTPLGKPDGLSVLHIYQVTIKPKDVLILRLWKAERTENMFHRSAHSQTGLKYSPPKLLRLTHLIPD